jgi:uncharacterized membrane protein YcaP (DUF421 family)
MQIILRSLALFLFVWLVMRIAGRKELAQMTSFDLVIVVVLGDLIQQGVTGDDRSVVGAMLAVTTFVLLAVLLSYVSFRFRATRPILEGSPVIVVRDGRFLTDVMRMERLTEDEVREAARMKGIERMSQVKVGILEADGQFAFIQEGREGGDPG